MSSSLRRAAFAALALIAGCASPSLPPAVAPSPPPPEEPPPVVLTEPAAPSTPGDEVPTGPLTAFDLADDQAMVIAFVDVRAIIASELWPAAQPALKVAGFDTVLAAWTRACGADPLAAIDEVVLSAGDRGVLAVARFRGDGAAALACARAGGTGTVESLQGQTAVHVLGTLVAVTGDLLLVGDRRSLDAALANVQAKKRSRTGRALLDRSPGTVISVVSAPLGGQFGRTDWHVRLTHDALSANATLDAGSPALADAALAKIRRDLENPRFFVDGASAPGLALLKDVKLAVDGSALTAAFTVPPGDVGAREAVVQNLAQIALAVARHERSQRVRSQLWVIASQLDSYAHQSDGKSGRPRGHYPPSARQTPAKIPSGGSSMDLAEFRKGTWAAIGYAPPASLNHSFEIVTSPDRKKAIIRASGDPDGDGGLETLGLEITLDGPRKELPRVKRPKVVVR